jgi:hypothetical protein
MNDAQRRYHPEQKRIMMVGNYGSGKTELSVNLALGLRSRGEKVTIADLDVVNPYFRCREERDVMTAQGIRVVVPSGNRRYADLPIVLPEIKGMLQNDAPDAPFSIFDVGGDDVGALMLSSLREAIGDRSYALLQVINTKRPFTSTVEGCLDMKAKIERTAQLGITGLAVNTHLMGDTTPEVILEGYDIAREMTERTGIPIAFVAVMEKFFSAPALNRIEAPLFILNRRMTPPWREGLGEISGGVSSDIGL